MVKALKTCILPSIEQLAQHAAHQLEDPARGPRILLGRPEDFLFREAWGDHAGARPRRPPAGRSACRSPPGLAGPGRRGARRLGPPPRTDTGVTSRLPGWNRRPLGSRPV